MVYLHTIVLYLGVHLCYLVWLVTWRVLRIKVDWLGWLDTTLQYRSRIISLAWDMTTGFELPPLKALEYARFYRTHTYKSKRAAIRQKYRR